MINYTTADIKASIDPKDVEAVAAEAKKAVISNDAYALTEALNNLAFAIRSFR